MNKLIKIAQEDIDNGIPRKPKLCAITLAAQRRFKTDDCSTGVSILRVEQRRFALSKEAIEFRHNFDLGRPVKPMTIKVTPFED